MPLKPPQKIDEEWNEETEQSWITNHKQIEQKVETIAILYKAK